MRLDDILLMTFAFIGIILLGIFGYIDYKDKVSWFLYNARYYADLDKEDEDEVK